MKYEIIFGWLPVPIFVSNKDLTGGKFDAKTYTFLLFTWIVVSHKFDHDGALLKHELTHCKQYYKGGLWVHSLRYRFSQSYRFSVEKEAYAVQCKEYKKSLCCTDQWVYSFIDRIAATFASKYRLDPEKYTKLHITAELIRAWRRG